LKKCSNSLCEYSLKMWSHAYKKVKWSLYRPGVAQRVGRGIALLFYDRGTRKGWVVSSTPQTHFTPEKDPVPILQEAGWAPGPVWTAGKSRPHRYSIPDRPARSRYTDWATRPTYYGYSNIICNNGSVEGLYNERRRGLAREYYVNSFEWCDLF